MVDEPTVTRLAQLVEQVERDVVELERQLGALTRRTWVWWLTLAATVLAGVALLLPWARYDGAELAAVAFGLHTEHTLGYRVLYLVAVAAIAVALTLGREAAWSWLVTAAGAALAGASGWTWLRLADAEPEGIAGPHVGLFTALTAAALLIGCGFAATRVGLWRPRVP